MYIVPVEPKSPLFVINHPFFFTVVNNDTQTVFTDTTDAIKMYYYKGEEKSYITDLAIFRSSSRYKFILSSATIIRTNIDSNVQRFYVERPAGITDTLNVADSVRSSACTGSTISQSFSCTNAATYYYDDTATGGYNVFVIKEN